MSQLCKALIHAYYDYALISSSPPPQRAVWAQNSADLSDSKAWFQHTVSMAMGIRLGTQFEKGCNKLLIMAAVCWVITMLARDCAKHLSYIIPISTSNDATWKPFFFFFLVFCLFSFQGHARSIWRFPSQGFNRSCSRRPTPQPQQREIRATSATYATAHGNTGSLTH